MALYSINKHLSRYRTRTPRPSWMKVAILGMFLVPIPSHDNPKRQCSTEINIALSLEAHNVVDNEHLLPNDAIALTRWRSGRRSVLILSSGVCRLRLLQLNTVRLAIWVLPIVIVISLVGAIIRLARLRLSGILRWWLRVVVVVVRLRVSISRTSGPASPVEGLATGLTAATRGQTTVK